MLLERCKAILKLNSPRANSDSSEKPILDIEKIRFLHSAVLSSWLVDARPSSAMIILPPILETRTGFAVAGQGLKAIICYVLHAYIRQPLFLLHYTFARLFVLIIVYLHFVDDQYSLANTLNRRDECDFRPPAAV
jgi:hypothetical protein